MSLETRVADFAVSVATDYKQLRTWITGSSTGTLANLITTDKSSVINAINEIKASATGAPPAATESVAGVAEIATQTETSAGVDDVRIITSLKYRTDADARYQPKSANLTSLSGFTTSTDAALAANSDTVLPSQKAVKAYADALLDANNAYVYKGGIDASTNPNYPAAQAGWTYKVTVAGKLGGASGVNVEVGDSATCLVDNSASGNQATVGNNWLVQQTNIDGAVVGPATSTAGDFAIFSGTTGKVVQDTGLSFDVDGTMAANSDARVPSQKAVRTYAYSKTEIGNADRDFAAAYNAAKA